MTDKLPRNTVREALAAQILEEMDGLIARAEGTAEAVKSVEGKLVTTTKALLDAADKFNLAVTSFAEAAKTDLREHVQQQAQKTIVQSKEEHAASLQEVARTVFRTQALDEVDRLATRLRSMANAHGRPNRWKQIGEQVACGAVGAALIALGLALAGKL